MSSRTPGLKRTLPLSAWTLYWPATLGLSGLAVLTGCEVAIPDRLALVVTDAGVGAAPPCVDLDGDGICAADDCDDTDPLRGGPERCDGVDTDCDGRVDEGFGVGTGCTGMTPGGCEQPGVVRCLGFGGTVCDLLPGPPEACNGLDDDCDGQIDEGDPGGGGPCDAGGVGACGAGRFVCTSGTLGCVAHFTPGQQAETCNGLDDDCDGLTDEGEGGIPLTASCYFGPAGTEGVGKCLAGTWSCSQGQWGPTGPRIAVELGALVGLQLAGVEPAPRAPAGEGPPATPEETPALAGRLVDATGGTLIRVGLEWHNGGRLWFGPFGLLTRLDDPFSGELGAGRALWVAGFAGRARPPVFGAWAIDGEGALGGARWADVGQGGLWGVVWRFSGGVSWAAQPDLELVAGLGWLGAEAGNAAGLFRERYDQPQLLAMGGYVLSLGVRLR